jgi:hypothetical protein
LVGGWGPEADRYIANAVRKLRLTRFGMDTLSLTGVDTEEVVESVDDEGRFPWGDFPYGGAVRLTMGTVRPWVAASAFKQDEDVIAASLVGSVIGVQLWRSIGVSQL